MTLRLCGSARTCSSLVYRDAQSNTVVSSTSAPRAQSSQLVSSIGEWLIPFTLGTKIIPIGPSSAIICASWPAPLGWYTGRTSVNTLKAVLDEGGFLYSSDSYADDLPYWVNGPNGPHLIIPYTLDANDMRFINAQGFGDGDEFFAYLKDAFDLLYAEGERAPKMMSIGLHCRLVGRPGRAAALTRFLDYVVARERVWLATRLDIARHWHREHRSLAAAAPMIR